MLWPLTLAGSSLVPSWDVARYLGGLVSSALWRPSNRSLAGNSTFEVKLCSRRTSLLVCRRLCWWQAFSNQDLWIEQWQAALFSPTKVGHLVPSSGLLHSAAVALSPACHCFALVSCLIPWLPAPPAWASWSRIWGVQAASMLKWPCLESYPSLLAQLTRHVTLLNTSQMCE